jgi:hypothetical protein
MREVRVNVEERHEKSRFGRALGRSTRPPFA